MDLEKLHPDSWAKIKLSFTCHCTCVVWWDINSTASLCVDIPPMHGADLVMHVKGVGGENSHVLLPNVLRLYRHDLLLQSSAGLDLEPWDLQWRLPMYWDYLSCHFGGTPKEKPFSITPDRAFAYREHYSCVGVAFWNVDKDGWTRTEQKYQF